MVSFLLASFTCVDQVDGRFSDVTHEVKPVLKGRRLVLTYNLIHTAMESKELAANSNLGMVKLKRILSKWEESFDTFPELPTSLALLLDHQYTDASLCFDGLKGHDQLVGAHLRNCGSQVGFSVYLASFDMSVEGGCDEDGGYFGSNTRFHNITEEFDRQATLKRVVELDGTEVARDLDFKDGDFIQEQLFKDLQPDDEEYSGFTGNEGVSATHFYHRMVRPRSVKEIQLALLTWSTRWP